MIGDRISKVSEGLCSVKLVEPCENVETVKNNLDTYLSALDECRECRSALEDVTPPDCVKNEHLELLEAVQMFIDGTDLVCKAVDLNEKSLDKSQAIDGLILQNKGKTMVNRVSSKISVKLV